MSPQSDVLSAGGHNSGAEFGPNEFVSARIVGVGNILLGDEGVGVHIVRELHHRGAFPGVDLVDGGVAGSSLLSVVEDSDRVVVIDAVDAPLPPGTLVELAPSDLSCGREPRYSLHDFGLADVFGLIALRGRIPAILILGIVPTDTQTYRIGLSPQLSARFDELVNKVVARSEKFFATVSSQTEDGAAVDNG